MRLENQILDVVLNIQATQIEMQKEMQEMKKEQQEFKKEQQEMKKEQQEFKKEQQEMKKEMNKFKKEQQEMKKTQLSQDGRLNALEEELHSIKATLDELMLLRRQDSLNIAKILEVQTKQFQEMREAM